MKMTILTQIKEKNSLYNIKTKWLTEYFLPNIDLVAPSKSEAIKEMSEQISVVIEEYGRIYINYHSIYNGLINCPQGYVALPLDSWYCKDTKTSCPLQAQLNMLNKEDFFNLCTNTDEKKEGIWNAIANFKYRGFHHIVGKYRCVLCNKKRNYYNYHYPWELTYLGDNCDMITIWDDIERAKELIKSGFPRVAKNSALCSKCFLKISNMIQEIDLSTYEIIEYNYERSSARD